MFSNYFFLINLVGVLEKLMDFLGLPLFDKTGKYGFQSRKNLTDLLALQINRTPRKQCFEDQVSFLIPPPHPTPFVLFYITISI